MIMTPKKVIWMIRVTLIDYFIFFLHFKMFIIFTVVCHLFGDNNLFKNNFILILLDLSLPLVNSFLNTYQVAAPDPGVVHAVMCQV